MKAPKYLDFYGKHEGWIKIKIRQEISDGVRSCLRPSQDRRYTPEKLLFAQLQQTLNAQNCARQWKLRVPGPLRTRVQDYQTFPYGIFNEPCYIMYIELAHYMCPVCLNGFDADVHKVGDFIVCVSFSNKL